MVKFNMSVKDSHIHLYYNEQTIDTAKSICSQVEKLFNVEIGRFHEKNVGPHPRWSVQILVQNSDFGEVLTWTSLNREGLTVFTHPNTGDDLRDHRDHAIWMGEVLDLELSIF